MIVYKNLKDKIASSDMISLSSLEDLVNKDEQYSIDLSNLNIMCLDVDDTEARNIILQLHQKGMLDRYTYSIKPNGSAHFYFTNLNQHKSVKHNNSKYFNVLNLIFEVKFKNKVQITHPDYEYHNFDKLFNNNLPTFEQNDPLFYLIGYVENNNLKPFKNSPNVIEIVNKLIGAQEKDGTQRGKTLLSLTSTLYNANYNTNQVNEIIDIVDKVFLGDSISDTDGIKALEDLKIQAQTYAIQNKSEKLKNNDIEEQHQSFVIKSVDKNKNTTYKIDLYGLALYFIKTFNLRTRDNNIYGEYNGKYLNFSKEQNLELNSSTITIGDILYFETSKIFSQYQATYNFKVQDYNNIKEHILKSAPLLTDENLSDMNIVVGNGTLVYDKINKKYSFSDKIIPHIITFNHIKWLDENSKDFDKNLYEIRKKTIDDYIASLVDEDTIPTIWKMIATTFLYNSYHRKAFIFTGKGRNGKSTFITFLQKINHSNYSNISINDINSQFMGHKLNNNTLNTSGEMDGTIKGTDSILKSIIAGDKISMDVKNDKKGVDFINKSTLIFATNNDLVIPDYTSALLDRLLFIDFKRTFANARIENFIEEKLKDEYSYYYILKTSLKYIEEMDNNNWEISSKDDKEQQIKFKLSNSQVYKWFVYSDMLDTNQRFNQSAIALLKPNNIQQVYKRFVLGLKELYDNEHLTVYGVNKFIQQMKDVMNLKVVIKNNREHFECVKEEDIKLFENWKEEDNQNGETLIQPTL